MLNINVFRPVVHEKKIFQDLLKFPLFCPLSTQPLDLYKSEFLSPMNVFYQVWLKLTWWFLRRSSLKEKLTPDGQRTCTMA